MRRRVRIQAYKFGSKSARNLGRYLGVKRILPQSRSRFRGRSSDIIINWGKPEWEVSNSLYLNPLNAVTKASNKLTTLQTLSGAGVSIPEYSTSLEPLNNTTLYVCRQTLYGHSGRGIVVGTSEELPRNAPLYTKLIKKVKEYRVIVVGDRVVDVKLKKKKREWEGERDKYVWNHSNGYTFTRNVGEYNLNVHTLGVDAVKALGLNYGAVDIIEDSQGELYVLEVNTAFGLEGTTIELVGDAIKQLIGGV